MLAGIAFCIGSLMQTVSHGNVAVMFSGRAVGGLVSPSLSLTERHVVLTKFRVSVLRACLYLFTSPKCRLPPSVADSWVPTRLESRQEPVSVCIITVTTASANELRFLDQLWCCTEHAGHLCPVDHSFRHSTHPRWSADTWHVFPARIPSVSFSSAPQSLSTLTR